MSTRILKLNQDASMDEGHEETPKPRGLAVPQFAPFFDVNTPLPKPKNADALGYITSLPEGDYRAWPGVNATLLKQATPCEMLHELTVKKVRTWNSVTLGSVLHMAALEPWKLDRGERDKHLLLCETEGLDTERAKKQRLANPGKLLVTPEIMESAYGCMAAISADAKAVDILKPEGRHTEATAIVFDPDFMVWRKARVDLLRTNADYIADVKTTSASLDRHSWERECWRWGYFQQAAWYLDTHWLLTGEWRARFRWIALTTSEPFMCRVFTIRNLMPDDPLYEQSSLAKSRATIGLDPSPRIGRLPMFINSARQTEELQRNGVALTKTLLRSTWPGYEQEDPECEIL